MDLKGRGLRRRDSGDPPGRGATSRLRGRRAALLCLFAVLVLAAGVAFGPGSGFGLTRAADTPAPVPGGFLESATTGQVRPRLTAAQIQAFLPARGPFTFPPPYNTAGVRITNADDCPGTDCLEPVGYSYWRNINNHVGQNEMLIFLGLNRVRGGPGVSLFSYDKTTDQVTALGPLFDPSSNMSWRSGEGWYWSARRPTTIYIDNGPQMLRYDVIARQFETVFDVGPEFGADKWIRQMHSSDDDRVHSATLVAMPSTEMLGCVVYHEDTGAFQYFPKIGNFNECHVDKSGRWLMILEDVDFKYDLEMRIIDLQTGNERLVWDQAGAVGHADMGYGYVVGADNWNIFPNAILLWDFSKDPLSGLLVSHTNEWTASAPNHIAHGNARADVSSDQQYACGSGVSRSESVWSNEIICFRLDGSLDVLVVAPVLADLDAPGGDNDYRKEPKGNLDVTGRYFVWTGNAGGDRLDAFIVKVPSQFLTEPRTGVVPPVLSVTDSPDPIPAGGTITYTLSYFNRGGIDLTGVVIQDKVPPETSFVSASAGGALSNDVVAWTVGILPAGGSGSVRMTARLLPSFQGGGTVINGISSIDSNETATVTGFPASTTVVPFTAPIVTAVVETGTNSVYVLQGGTWTIRIDGANFQPGASVNLGPDITTGSVSLEGPGRLTVPITVLSSAGLGRRAVTVTNPIGLSGTQPDALVVVRTADITGDCRIDGADLNVLARAWNIRSSEPGFVAAADLDGDGYVGPLDLAILAEYFGQRLATCA